MKKFTLKTAIFWNSQSSKNEISWITTPSKIMEQQRLFQKVLKHHRTGLSKKHLFNQFNAKQYRAGFTLTRVQELSFDSSEFCGSLLIRQHKHHIRIFWLSSAKRKTKISRFYQIERKDNQYKNSLNTVFKENICIIF